MCEAHAYLVKDGKEEMVLESVDAVEIRDDQAFLVNIFGEQKTLKARLKKYDNRERKILFEALD